MSTELSENLSLILKEKNEKIIPENIRKGTTVFDVDGEFRKNVKSFGTAEEMQNDSDVEDGDVAIVYNSELIPMTETSIVSSIEFPDTVVFDEAVTTGVSGYLKDDAGNSNRVVLNATNFNIAGSTLFNFIVRYTSSDGITYTKVTDVKEYIFEPARYFEGTWSDGIGKFILLKNVEFNGLYEYKNSTDMTIYSDTVTNTKYYKIPEEIYRNYNEVGGRQPRYIIHESHYDAGLKCNVIDSCTMIWAKIIADTTLFYTSDGNILITLATTSDGDCVEILEYNSTDGVTFDKVYTTEEMVAKSEEYSTLNWTNLSSAAKFFYVLYKGNEDVVLYNERKLAATTDQSIYMLTLTLEELENGTAFSTDSSMKNSVISMPYSGYKYWMAPTQLTLNDASQLSKGLIAYGENGIIEGTHRETLKMFDTIENMNSSEDNEEGDLAIIYRSEIQNSTVDSKFSSAVFPATVVLPEALIDSVEIMYRATDSSIMFDCWGEMNASYFNMSCYTESGEINISYESADGITYTRTDDGEETIDFGTEIYYAYADYWNDAIGYFIQIGGKYFDGLFEYELDVESEDFYFLPIEDLTMDTDYKFTWNKSYNENYIFSAEDVNKFFEKVWEYGDSLGMSFNGAKDLAVICEGKLTTFMYTAVFDSSSRYNTISCGTVYDVATARWWIRLGNTISSTDSSSIVKLQMNNGELVVTEMSGVTGVFDNSYALDVVPETMQFRVEAQDTSPYVSVNNNGTSVTTYSGNIGYDCKYHLDKYVVAPTQFTATSKDVYVKSFYGKDGVVEGTLQETTNLTLEELQLRVNIWNNYNELSVSDTDLTYCFRDYTGTAIPKLDTSVVTKMPYMFYNAANIITIPELNTSNVTEMGAMFVNCTSLISIPLLDTGNVVNVYNMFRGCTALTSVPQLNISKATSVGAMFYGCTALTTVPQLDISSATNVGYMFTNCTSLSEESLNNILAMCVSATAYTGTKTLATLGLTAEQATTCTTLSNWSAASAAGWTTGY